MNLEKLHTSVCLAFQISEGPFDILLTFEGGQEEATLSKEEIKVLSLQEFTIMIEMSRRISERRWGFRSDDVRRNNL